MTVTYHVGDTREVIATIPDGSVDLIATSPPFLALRSYLPAGHVSKGDEIGSEANPAEFIDMLLGLTAEWGRVLAPHGSIAIELGDTYSGSGGAGGDYNEGGLRDGQGKFTGSGARDRPQDGGYRQSERVLAAGSVYGPNSGIRNMNDKVQGGGPGWPRAKSLALIPQLYATSLAYGRNVLRSGLTAHQLLDFMERIEENLPDLSAAELLTMARQWIPQAEAIQRAEFQPWLVRNVIVWHRPNPAVGALGDKVRPSTSYIVVATRSAKRWFDLTAVRGEPSPNTHARLAQGVDVAERSAKSAARGNFATMPELATTAGAPPLDAWFDPYDGTHDTWTLTTQPSKLCHYAMWPAKLAERLVLSMCPREVCRVCSEPRRRVEGPAEYVKPNGTVHSLLDMQVGARAADGVNQWSANGATFSDTGNYSAVRPTLGWSDCGHDNYRPGHVLDPFCGSGTTMATADLHGRDAIGIDFDARNKAIYPARYDEVSRALFGTKPELPGQGDLFADEEMAL